MLVSRDQLMRLAGLCQRAQAAGVARCAYYCHQFGRDGIETIHFYLYVDRSCISHSWSIMDDSEHCFSFVGEAELEMFVAECEEAVRDRVERFGYE